MSTQLDSVLSVPWSTSATSIVSAGSDGLDPNNSSCLFDLVNGLYLIDSHITDKAFKYLRAADLNYLEFYEKYFILYDTMSVGDHKSALQYVWLFQKLNTSALASSSSDSLRSSASENELGLFKLINKIPSSSSLSSASSLSEFNKLKHEQRMHARVIITIYLANTLVNEAYNLVKPHIKNVKSLIKSPMLNENPSVKFSKELLVHFFIQIEVYKLWKQVTDLTSLDKDLLLMMFNFIEAFDKLDLVCMAIDLHVNNQNYKKAVELYDRHAKQIASSKHAYLSTMVEIARDVHYDCDFENEENTSEKYSLITEKDIKETMNFEYRFTVALRDLCKNSKRCIRLLNAPEDQTYIELLRTEAHEATSKIGSTQAQRQVKFSTMPLVEETPHHPIGTPIEATRTPVPARRSILAGSTSTRERELESKGRKQSTPHPTRGMVKFHNVDDDEDDYGNNIENNEQISDDETDDDNDDKDMDDDIRDNDWAPSNSERIADASVTEAATSIGAAPGSPPARFTRRSLLKPPMSENSRVLTSSLRINRVMGAGSVSAAKSVKFSAVKYTRNICVGDEHVNVDSQESMDLDEDNNTGNLFLSKNKMLKYFLHLT